MNFIHNRILWSVLLTLLMSSFGYYLSRNPAFERYEANGLDILFNLRGGISTTPIPEIVLVFIDESSLKEYGYYDPIPRRYLSRLIDSLAAKKAHTIALDIAFTERMAALDPAADNLLAKSMQAAGNVVGVSIAYRQPGGAYHIEDPDLFFHQAMAGVGYANVMMAEGSSGFATVRKVQPVMQSQPGDERLSFSAVLFCRYSKVDVGAFSAIVDQQEWKDTPDETRIDQGMLVNFTGPPTLWEKQAPGSWIPKRTGMFRTFRSSSITGGRALPNDWFNGKIVIVGNGSEFARDQFITPFFNSQHDYQLMRGAEVHANALHTLLHRRFIQSTPPVHTALLMFGFAGLMIIAAIRFRLIGEVITCLLLLVAAWVLAYGAFIHTHSWVPVISLSSVILLAYFAISVYLALAEERVKKQIKNMFERYAPHAYVAELIKNPTKLELGGEEKEISIIFCDIANFTGISEQLPPKRLVALLNDYFQAMTQVIFQQGGTLDKYIGDGILAVFGAPLSQPDHALKSCLAAIDMQKAMLDFQSLCREKNYPSIAIRIGVNTGTVVFGNIGSEIRYDYTGIGDAMNLTARLEAANKIYHSKILMSEFTHSQVSAALLTRELDTILVKGKSEKVRVYELIGRLDSQLPPGVADMLRSYREGLALYHSRDWNAAKIAFECALAYYTDTPTQMYINRCEQFIQYPPIADWDGVFRRHAK